MNFAEVHTEVSEIKMPLPTSTSTGEDAERRDSDGDCDEETLKEGAAEELSNSSRCSVPSPTSGGGGHILIRSASSLCSIPEDGQISFSRDLHRRPRRQRPPDSLNLSAGRRAKKAAEDDTECEVFHRSPVSLDNGYRPVMAQTFSEEDCGNDVHQSSDSSATNSPIADGDELRQSAKLNFSLRQLFVLTIRIVAVAAVTLVLPMTVLIVCVLLRAGFNWL